MLRALSDDLSFDLVGHLAMFGKARTRDLATTLGVTSSMITKRIKPLEEAGLVSRGTPYHTLVNSARVQSVLRESDRLEIGVMDLERAQAYRKFAARENMLRGVQRNAHDHRSWITLYDWQRTDEPGDVVLASDEGILVGDGNPRHMWCNLDYLPFLGLLAGMSASRELSAEWALTAAQRTVVFVTSQVERDALLPVSRYPGVYDASDAVFTSPRLLENARESYHWSRMRDPSLAGRRFEPWVRPTVAPDEDDDRTAAPPSPGGPPQEGRQAD